jgi:ethanolamine utilization protein EutN
VLIARVIGEVVATQKHASHVGRKALIVQPLQLDGSDRGDAVVALDAVDAGVGDRVLLVTEGYSAMTSVGRPESPIDMAVVGVIDLIDFGGNGTLGGAGTTSAPAPELPVGGREKLGLPAVPVEKKPGRKSKAQ